VQPTVLIVEDNQHQRQLYQEELTEEGYHVIAVGDGKEALVMMRDRRPNLVVLDVNMPGMDGLDTLSHLLEIAHQTPVIIHTAYASYKDSFVSWSADAYVVKSSDLTELKQTARRLLQDRADGAARSAE